MVFLILTTVIVLSFFVFTFVKALLAKFNNYLFTLIIEVIGAFIDFVFILFEESFMTAKIIDVIVKAKL